MRLVLMNGSAKGREFELVEGTNLIGRWDPEDAAFPEIDLESEDAEAKISRKHAMIRVSGASVTVEDLGSLNGTFLNRSERLERGKPLALKAGDEVNVGALFLRFEA
jgi:pSer/pThr/pTyr-binding forkhead associated (FHA) protein